MKKLRGYSWARGIDDVRRPGRVGGLRLSPAREVRDHRLLGHHAGDDGPLPRPANPPASRPGIRWSRGVQWRDEVETGHGPRARGLLERGPHGPARKQRDRPRSLFNDGIERPRERSTRSEERRAGQKGKTRTVGAE